MNEIATIVAYTHPKVEHTSRIVDLYEVVIIPAHLKARDAIITKLQEELATCIADYRVQAGLIGDLVAERDAARLAVRHADAMAAAWDSIYFDHTHDEIIPAEQWPMMFQRDEYRRARSTVPGTWRDARGALEVVEAKDGLDCGVCGHSFEHHTYNYDENNEQTGTTCDCEGDGEAGLCPCPDFTGEKLHDPRGCPPCVAEGCHLGPHGDRVDRNGSTCKCCAVQR